MKKKIATLAPALLILGLTACEPEVEPEEAEHPSVALTQWNDSTELFLEYPHLVAGEQTGNWAIHLSNMTTFKPIIEGTLRVVFLQSGAEVHEFSINAPARAGIFLLDPAIPAAGTYDVALELQSGQLRSRHVVEDVVVWEDFGQLPVVDEEEGGGIAFLKEQQWNMDFAIAPATRREVTRTVPVPPASWLATERSPK